MENILEKICNLALKFIQPLSPEEVYSTIVKEGVSLMDARYGSLILEQDGELKICSSDLPLSAEFHINKINLFFKMINHGQVLVRGAGETPKILGKLGKEDIKSHIFIPLYSRRGIVGFLIIHSSKDVKLTTKQQNALKLFGSLVSLVVRKTQLYDEAQKALELRDLFISVAAHELRTPITTIHGYVQLLHNKMKKENTPQSRWVRELHSESLRLTSLVNELLETSRIKTGQLQYVWKECNIKDVIEQSVEAFKLNHPHREVVLNYERGKHLSLVVGDYGKLIQVLNNVLDNAAKFSSATTPVLIALKIKTPFVIIQVQDEGEGIDKKDLSRIFDGFYKGGKSSQKGIGLGLYLAKSIIEEHHGSIHLHSRVSRGTLVEIRLPTVRLTKVANL